MTTVKSIMLALFALFALAIMACGDDDGDFEPPPPGEYVFDVTGTMEVEFNDELVTAGAINLHGNETGNVTGSLTSTLDGNELTIRELGLTVTFGANTIVFSPAGDSTGAVKSNGTALELNLDATTLDGVASTSDKPIQIETDDLFPGLPPLNFTPPEGWDPLPFTNDSGDTVFTLHSSDFKLGLMGDIPVGDEPLDDEPIDDEEGDQEGEEGSEEGEEGEEGDEGGEEEGDELDGEPMSFTDDADDTRDCASGDPLDDPNGDILTVDVTPVPGGVDVGIGLAGPPTDSFRDPSFNTEVFLNRDGKEFAARGSIHLGEEAAGYLDLNGIVIPGTESNVRVDSEGMSFFFPTVPGPGDTLEVLVFHLPVDGGPVTCDDFFQELP